MKSEIQNGLAIALIIAARQAGVSLSLLNKTIEIAACYDSAYGDFYSNIALKYAKVFNMKPHELADILVVSVPLMQSVVGMVVADTGLINIRLTKDRVCNV